MFKRNEKQSLLNARTRSLGQAEERIEELSTLKKHYKETASEQREIITKQENFINYITRELYSNIKTDKQKVDKLKELVSDYQSLN